jgi:uncharacterized Zn finger protein
MAWNGRFSGKFPAYVSVADRSTRALAAAAQLTKGIREKGTRHLEPVTPIVGRKIARSFWGGAWCKNLETYSDYATRLPRGRSYVRHGCVADLQIASGRVTALVSGTSLYEITIGIKPLPAQRWDAIAAASAGQIDSLVTLLRGSLPESLLQQVTNRDTGLFPSPGEIELDCSCPDWADMCKHVAAALYGVGARLDERPELLFTLRGVNHLELVSSAMVAGMDNAAVAVGTRVLGDADLSALFGIEMAPPVAAKRNRTKRATAPRAAQLPTTSAAAEEPVKKRTRTKATATSKRPLKTVARKS